MAAGISFWCLISLVPILILGVAAAGYVLSSPTTYQRALDFFWSFIPSSLDSVALERNISAIITTRGVVGGLGIAGLLWTGSLVFVYLELALNEIWDVPHNRSLLFGRLVALGMMLVTGVFMLGSIALTWVLEFVKGYQVALFNWRPGSLPVVWEVVALALPAALSVALFTLIYAVVPNARVDRKAALTAGTFAGVLWELAKVGFGWYLTRFAHYNAVYHSLGSLVALVTWIYYSALILILGAEVADVISRSHGTPPAVEEGAAETGGTRAV